MAKPRVFVSSTYYDLKYVRERLEQFIQSYNCESILFESDDIYFQPQKSIDKSCYEEVKTCHLMVLIIGGRYGSKATQQDKKQYEDNYVSITQKEFESATEIGIPTMIFIDKNVYADYETYITNRDTLPNDFKFAHVDDIKIFQFIDIVKSRAIKTFDKIEDIEQYFSNQISGMLYDYLIGLQKKKEQENIQQSIKQLNVISNGMQEMLNTVAKEILKGTDQIEYQKLLKEQKQSLIDFFFDMLLNEWVIDKNDNYDTNKAEDYAKGLSQILLSNIFNAEFINKYNNSNRQEKLALRHLTEKKLTHIIQNKYPDIELKFHFTRYIKQINKIWQTIGNDPEIYSYFEDKLIQMLYDELIIPF